MAPGVDLSAIARQTPGMSGADLANLLNEGTPLAVIAPLLHSCTASVRHDSGMMLPRPSHFDVARRSRNQKQNRASEVPSRQPDRTKRNFGSISCQHLGSMKSCGRVWTGLTVDEEIDSDDIFNALERISIGLEKKAAPVNAS